LRFHYRLGWVAALGLARLLWRFRVRGAERIPLDGPVVIASNHISNWDPVLVGLGCPREVSFLAKEELFRNPLLAWLIRAYNAIPVRREASDTQALRLAISVLRDDGAILMFPEGTRSRDGTIGRAKEGVAFLATKAGANVVPAFITGSNALGSAFAGRRRLGVAYGEPIRGDADGSVAGLTERIMESIAALRAEDEMR